jgi:acyl-CoA thioester hydrolase
MKADETVDELLKDYSFVVQWPVAWRDMDALRHVNNTRYFEYFEHVRIAYGEQCGTSPHRYATGIGPILAETKMKFIKPVKHPDTLSLGLRLTTLEKTEYIMEFIAVSHALKAVAAVGDCRMVFYDYNKGVRAEIPDEIIAGFERMEKRALR